MSRNTVCPFGKLAYTRSRINLNRKTMARCGCTVHFDRFEIRRDYSLEEMLLLVLSSPVQWARPQGNLRGLPSAISRFWIWATFTDLGIGVIEPDPVVNKVRLKARFTPPIDLQERTAD